MKRAAWTAGGDDWDIWVMNADGTGKADLTATPATIEIGPSWQQGTGWVAGAFGPVTGGTADQ